MAWLGIGGPVDGGAQYVSWLHDADLLAAVDFLIARADIAGPVNLAAPNPLPQRDFARVVPGRLLAAGFGFRFPDRPTRPRGSADHHQSRHSVLPPGPLTEPHVRNLRFGSLLVG